MQEFLRAIQGPMYDRYKNMEKYKRETNSFHYTDIFTKAPSTVIHMIAPTFLRYEKIKSRKNSKSSTTPSSHKKDSFVTVNVSLPVYMPFIDVTTEQMSKYGWMNINEYDRLTGTEHLFGDFKFPTQGPLLYDYTQNEFTDKKVNQKEKNKEYESDNYAIDNIKPEYKKEYDDTLPQHEIIGPYNKYYAIKKTIIPISQEAALYSKKISRNGYRHDVVDSIFTARTHKQPKNIGNTFDVLKDTISYDPPVTFFIPKENQISQARNKSYYGWKKNKPIEESIEKKPKAIRELSTKTEKTKQTITDKNFRTTMYQHLRSRTTSFPVHLTKKQQLDLSLDKTMITRKTKQDLFSKSKDYNDFSMHIHKEPSVDEITFRYYKNDKYMKNIDDFEKQNPNYKKKSGTSERPGDRNNFKERQKTFVDDITFIEPRNKWMFKENEDIFKSSMVKMYVPSKNTANIKRNKVGITIPLLSKPKWWDRLGSAIERPDSYNSRYKWHYRY